MSGVDWEAKAHQFEQEALASDARAAALAADLLKLQDERGQNPHRLLHADYAMPPGRMIVGPPDAVAALTTELARLHAMLERGERREERLVGLLLAGDGPPRLGFGAPEPKGPHPEAMSITAAEDEFQEQEEKWAADKARYSEIDPTLGEPP